jgi:hypothetical protein
VTPLPSRVRALVVAAIVVVAVCAGYLAGGGEPEGLAAVIGIVLVVGLASWPARRLAAKWRARSAAELAQLEPEERRTRAKALLRRATIAYLVVVFIGTTAGLVFLDGIPWGALWFPFAGVTLAVFWVLVLRMPR